MDFNRLASGLDAGISKQLAEQLLANQLFRDAAIKANRPEEDSTTQAQTAANTGLDNLLNALSNTLNQAVNAAEEPEESDAPTSTDAYSAESLEALMHHPLMDQVLSQMSMEDALGIRVLLGQVDADDAENIVGLLNSVSPTSVKKIEAILKNLSSEDIQKGVEFFQALFAPDDDTIFAQSGNFDVFYNSANVRTVLGADLDSFIGTAYQVTRKGGDFGSFMEAGTEVLQKGDYDDFRRFLQVSSLVALQNQNLEKFYDFGSQILEQSPNDYEGNAFQVYMTVAHGGSVEDFIDIASSLETTGFEGRNNLVDLTRVIVDFRNKGLNTPFLFQQMAAVANSGGNVREYMNEYMLKQGMMSTKPDPRASQFDRIERIDGEPMVIKKGEKAALFAQAISTQHGLLPESVLYWSSKEKGAMAQGTSYLDLSKLGVGVHHIAVKIGGYGGGTDTAIKTVIVEPAEGQEDTTEETTPVTQSGQNTNQGIVLPESGKIRVTVKQGAAGLRSDLYLRQNGQSDLVAERANNTASTTTMDKQYNAGDRLDLFIKTFRGGSSYEHGTDTETYNGQSYANVEQIGENKWRVSFEDLPGQSADWDYNDVVVEVELLPETAAAGSVDSAPVTTAVSKEEAIQMTQAALSALQSNGKVFEEYAAILKERYFKAIDEQIGYNQDYMRQLRDYMADQDQRSAELQAFFEQTLQALTGNTGSTAPNTDTGSTGGVRRGGYTDSATASQPAPTASAPPVVAPAVDPQQQAQNQQPVVEQAPGSVRRGGYQ